MHLFIKGTEVTSIEKATKQSRKAYADQTTIAKARESWYLEFDQGMNADVFLEPTNAKFIEKVLTPEELAKDPNIETMRFRSSEILNPHMRY